jgi:hypothetical protein
MILNPKLLNFFCVKHQNSMLYSKASIVRPETRPKTLTH